MLKIIELPENELYSHECGDFEYGDFVNKHLGIIRKKDYKKIITDSETSFPLILSYIRINTWKALEDLGVDVDVRYRFSYTDPYTELRHCSVIPYAIITSDKQKYLANLSDLSDWYKDMILDEEWNKAQHSLDVSVYKLLNDITSCIIGPGYTDTFMANDGHSSLDFSYLQLDNGDKILCINRVWHNK